MLDSLPSLLTENVAFAAGIVLLIVVIAVMVMFTGKKKSGGSGLFDGNVMEKLGSLSPTALLLGESDEEKEIHKLAKEINEA
jgi:hypothetical protein